MKHFIGEGLGRVIVLNLFRGDKLMESVRDKMQELGIKDAVLLSVVGSLSKLEYHRPINYAMSAEDEFLTIEQPMEIGSLSGAVINGQPHFHIVAHDHLNNTYGGHLEEGTTILYLAEIVLQEIVGLKLERRYDEHKTAYFAERAE